MVAKAARARHPSTGRSDPAGLFHVSLCSHDMWRASLCAGSMTPPGRPCPLVDKRTHRRGRPAGDRTIADGRKKPRKTWSQRRFSPLRRVEASRDATELCASHKFFLTLSSFRREIKSPWSVRHAASVRYSVPIADLPAALSVLRPPHGDHGGQARHVRDRGRRPERPKQRPDPSSRTSPTAASSAAPRSPAPSCRWPRRRTATSEPTAARAAFSSQQLIGSQGLGNGA